MMSVAVIGLLSLLCGFQEDASRQIPQLIEQLRSESAGERNEATRKLEEFGQAAAAELERAAQDKDVELAARARHLLRVLAVARELTPNLKKVLPGVAQRLTAGDLRWTEVFLEATARDEERKCKYPTLRGADLEPLAARALRGARTPQELLEVCAPICQRQLRSAIPEFIRLLRDEREDFRSVAVGELGNGYFLEAAPAIVPVLHDQESAVRILAIEALVKLHFKSAAPEIAALLKDEGTFVRGTAIAALGKLGYAEAVPEIARFIKDPEFDVRSAVVLALGRLGAKTMAPQIAGLLNVRDREPSPENTVVRGSAVTALGQLGYREAVPEIVPLLDVENVYVRAQAIRALWLLGAREAAPKVVPLLGHRDVLVGTYAREVLQHWNVRELIPDIEKMLEDRDVFVRQRALEALAALGAKESIPRMIGFIKDPDPYMRGLAAEALCLLGSREGIPVLLESDMLNASGMVRLNEFRQPSVWQALRQKTLRRNLEGWGPRIEELLAPEVGMPLEISVQGRQVLENGEWDRSISCEEGRPTLATVLEYMRFSGCEYIVEPDRIRVVPHAEALVFWREWWKNQQEKK
jgi:HEAT repeat protein